MHAHEWHVLGRPGASFCDPISGSIRLIFIAATKGPAFDAQRGLPHFLPLAQCFRRAHPKSKFVAIEAIALIEDGKVYKWKWAKTKLEIR